MPQGSLDGQKPKGKSNVYVTVFGILAFHVVVLGAMLLQGCKNTPQNNVAGNNTTGNDPLLMGTTNTSTPMDVAGGPVPNPFVTTTSNPVLPPPMVIGPTTTSNVVEIPTTVVTPAAAQEHVVVAKDTFATIAKKYGVSAAAIAKANPGVDSRKLKLGQKIKIPEHTAAVAGAGTTPTSTVAVEAPTTATAATKVTYQVKKGDTLTRIAKNQGTTVQKIKVANNLKTENIREGQKLKIPAKAEAAAPAAPAPVATPPATSTGYVTPLPGRTTASL
jgi:LysM repeat protein